MRWAGVMGLQSLILPGSLLVASLAVLLALRSSVLTRLRRAGTYAALLESAFRLPSLLWSLAGALAVSLQVGTFSPSSVRLASAWIAAFLVVSVSLALAAFCVRGLSVYGRKRNLAFAQAGLTHTLIYLVIVSLGLGITMGTVFGKSVTPLLTALGVGGLAVALALQDTLANLFAGVHILLENPIGVGEFVRLSSGEEGAVIDIGWRTTRLRNNNNIVVIPNTKITTGILTNYSLSDHVVGAEVVIHAGLRTDPELLRRLALEVASANEGVLADPAPDFLLDPGVTPFSLQAKLVIHVANRLRQAPVQSAVRMELWKAMRREGIDLPSAGVALGAKS